jgi:hypothetical protein
MNRQESEALVKLLSVCLTAVEYVGSANYPERESHAKAEVRRNFAEFRGNRFGQMGFLVSKKADQ